MPGRPPLGSEPPRRARPGLACARTAPPARALTQPQPGRRAPRRRAWPRPLRPRAPRPRPRGAAAPRQVPERARTGPASPGKEDAGGSRDPPGACGLGRSNVGAARRGSRAARRQRPPPTFLGAQRWCAPGLERARRSPKPWGPGGRGSPPARPAGARAVLLARVPTPGGVSCCVQASSSPLHRGSPGPPVCKRGSWAPLPRRRRSRVSCR